MLELSLPAMTRLALRELAQRVLHLDAQLASITKRPHRITIEVAPKLTAIHGVGPEVASTLLMTAGDNPHRMRSESAFAALCGNNPIPASSGKINRHRLNRSGDRLANAALWCIVVVRLSCDPRTRDYLAKRQAEGKTKTEAIRCLKRYVARPQERHLPALVAAVPARLPIAKGGTSGGDTAALLPRPTTATFVQPDGHAEPDKTSEADGDDREQHNRADTRAGAPRHRADGSRMNGT